MNRLLTCFAILFIPAAIYAAGYDIIECTYQYVSDNRNETVDEAELTAKQRAKVVALENKYGVDVSSIVATTMITESVGESAKSSSKFYTMGGTEVRGEWIETLQEKIIGEPVFEGGFWQVKVYVKGKARPKNASKIDIKTLVLRNGTDDLNQSLNFYDGDQLFVKFQSPVSGNVCIYLVGEDDMAYCLLPDQYNTTGHYAVKANTEYMFFSAKHFKETIQEYVLTSEKSRENNALYIVFSPNKLSKALDNESAENFRGDAMPRSLSHKDFLKWLASNQIHDEDMVVKKELITIFKK